MPAQPGCTCCSPCFPQLLLSPLHITVRVLPTTTTHSWSLRSHPTCARKKKHPVWLSKPHHRNGPASPHCPCLPLLPSADSLQDPGSKRGFYQAPAETSRKQLVSASNFPRSTSNKFSYLLKTLPSRFCPALILPCCPAMPGPQTGSSHPPFPPPARSAVPSSPLDKPRLAGGSAGGH